MRYHLNLKTRIIFIIALVLFLSTPFNTPAQRSNSARSSQPIRKPALNYRFAQGHSTLGIPFELSKNIVLLKMQVNNSQPLWFIFGGASSSVINTRFAKELGLGVKGKKSDAATGGNVEPELVHGVSLALPGLKSSIRRWACCHSHFLSRY